MQRIRIDDQGSVCGKQLGKSAEGMTDIINILKKVQMVSINVQDHTDLREKLKKLLVYSQASVTNVSD